MKTKKNYEEEIGNRSSFIVLQEMIRDIREGLKNVHENLDGIFLNEADEGQRDVNEGLLGIEIILKKIITLENDSTLKVLAEYRDIHEGLYYVKEGFYHLNAGLKDIHRGIYAVQEGLSDIFIDNIQNHSE